ncbi:MAG: hypothetical protein KC931_10580, partial [Candidatus Omnitrophica bacterium]|nr:hypothetical protein [Candidatus Omnitrophota bacterium]
YGQFMKFIQRGAIRIDSGESSSEFAHVAFLNPNGSLVLVVANPQSKAREFQVGWEGRTLRTTLAPESVATYRWRTN